MKKIVVNKELCSGCLNCVFACMMGQTGKDKYTTNLLDLDNQARCHIEFQDGYEPIFCKHCDEAECVITCMSGALYKDEDGTVKYDEKKCASCLMCVMSCPKGVLKINEKTRKIIKCDLCNGRDIPYCVENCPKGAITFEEVGK